MPCQQNKINFIYLKKNIGHETVNSLFITLLRNIIIIIKATQRSESHGTIRILKFCRKKLTNSLATDKLFVNPKNLP